MRASLAGPAPSGCTGRDGATGYPRPVVMSRMTDQIGRVLSGRYRLIAPVGTGASAQVFLADDVRLRRRVAVKVLHAALADDDAFLRRFRAEAQAAAALNHPNIVAVYDWGDDDGTPYIVTEYLGGGSLRAVLDQGVRLTPSQALLVGLEATRALDYAHRRGFVHRDVKPANLLFGEDGRLRIADFGLARALAEAAWTEPQGAVLGTARYASPEQAQGQPVDGKADVYSLGLVLIEAVTGTVPFAADTTIATLMARVGKPVEVPDALGPLQKPLARAGPPRPGRPARRRRAGHRADGQRRGPAAARAAAARGRRRRSSTSPPRRRRRRHDARRRHAPARGVAEPGEATALADGAGRRRLPAPPEYLDDDLVVDERRRPPPAPVALGARRGPARRAARHRRRVRVERGAHAQLRGARPRRDDRGRGPCARSPTTASRSRSATTASDGSTPGEVLAHRSRAGRDARRGRHARAVRLPGQHARARCPRDLVGKTLDEATPAPRRPPATSTPEVTEAESRGGAGRAG